MDDTENYLNSILKKRLGSVANYGTNAKTIACLTRIPKQQQKIETMPTVFRKKHETVYIQKQNQPSSYSQPEQYSMKSVIKNSNTGTQSQISEQSRHISSQRVEYMLISKRIQNKSEDQFISPTVDVTNYQKNQRPKQNNFKSNGEFHSTGNSYSDFQCEINKQQQSKTNSSLQSKISVITDKSKRKKIF